MVTSRPAVLPSRHGRPGAHRGERDHAARPCPGARGRPAAPADPRQLLVRGVLGAVRPPSVATAGGSWRRTCAATATPTRRRSTPPGACGTSPKTWRPCSTRACSRPATRPLVAPTRWAAAWRCTCSSTTRAGAAGLLLESPVSPYGFGGTRDVDGTPTTEDFAGTGGGGVNPSFVERCGPGTVRRRPGRPAPGDARRPMWPTPRRSAPTRRRCSTRSSPRRSGRTTTRVTRRPARTGRRSPRATRGVLNALSPRWFSVADALVARPDKPPIAWVRGDRGRHRLGYLPVRPGLPRPARGGAGLAGRGPCPPQPMIGQTRAVLERYAAAGGSYVEHVLGRLRPLAAHRAAGGVPGRLSPGAAGRDKRRGDGRRRTTAGRRCRSSAAS